MPDHPFVWIGFGVFVLAMLALDLGVFRGKSHEVSLKEALTWSEVWIGLALIFDAAIYHWDGGGEGATSFLPATWWNFPSVWITCSCSCLFLVISKCPNSYGTKVALLGHCRGARHASGIPRGRASRLITKFHWIIYGSAHCSSSAASKWRCRRRRKFIPNGTRC